MPINEKITLHTRRSPQSPRFQSPEPRTEPETISPATGLNDFGGEFLQQRPAVRKNHFLRGVVTIVILALIAGGVGYAVNRYYFTLSKNKQETFHAVFLTNGQAFFGTIRSEDEYNIILDDVFYMQLVNRQMPPAEEGGEPQVVQVPQLVRKGDEYYGPSGTIRINRNQVTTIEELREDSDILKEIRAQLTS